MSDYIIGCCEKPDSATYHQDLSNGKRVQTATTKYVIQTSGPDISEEMVKRAVGLPQEYFFHPRLLGLRCKSRELVQEDLYSWVATVEWTDELKDLDNKGQDPNQDQNPCQDEPNWEWDTEERKILPTVARNVYKPGGGDNFEWGPVCNSAGDPYQPAPEIPDGVPLLIYERKELFFNPEMAYQYTWAVNSDDFMGVGKRMVLCRKIKAKEDVIDIDGKPFYFWRVHYEFLFNTEIYKNENGDEIARGWDTQLIDAGPQYFDTPEDKALNKLTDFTDKNGNPCVGLLDGNGHKLGQGLPTCYNVFRFRRELEFSKLSITFPR